MDRITEITEATLNALAPVRHASAEQLGLPETLHQQFSTAVEQAYRGARKAGFSEADAEDIRFALIALVDETMLTKGGALSTFWLPKALQLRQYGEQVAGKAFYERLDKLRGDASRSEIVLVYYLCLLLGFRGKFRVRGGELEVTDLLIQLRSELTKAGWVDVEAELAPHGGRPYEAMVDRQRNLLIVWIAAAAASAAGLLYLSLQLTLTASKIQVLNQLRSAIGG